MGKKKNSEYNDFVDGEKLRDNTEVRTTLNYTSSSQRDVSPPSTQHSRRANSKFYHGKGGLKKPPLTHFLCLPLMTDTSRSQLETNLSALTNHLNKTTSIPPRAVRPVGSIHLTLGVMSLTTPQKLNEAHELLQSINLHSLLRDISDQIIAEQAALDGSISENLNAAAFPDIDSLTVNLQAMVPMQSPTKTSILYANPWDATGRLYPFASALREQFVRSGFVVDEGRKLKLHATLINTVYAKPKGSGRRGRKSGVRETLKHLEHKVSPHHHASDGEEKRDGSDDGDSVLVDGEDASVADEKSRGEGHGPDAKSWLKFDATSLIEQYKDFVWAKDVRVDKVQICKMGAKKIWSGGVEGEGEIVDERYEVVFEKGIYE